MEGNKKKRGCNYTEFEKDMLLTMLKKYKHIIDNKETNSIFIKKKKEAWQQVAIEFNRHATTGPRNWLQLRHLYDNLKQKVRKGGKKPNIKRYCPQDEQTYTEPGTKIEVYIEDIKKEEIDDGKHKIFNTSNGPYNTSNIEDIKEEETEDENEETQTEMIDHTTDNPEMVNHMTDNSEIIDHTTDNSEIIDHTTDNFDEDPTYLEEDNPQQNGPKKNKKQKQTSAQLKEKYFKMKFENAKLERKLLIQKNRMEIEIYKLKLDLLKRKLNNTPNLGAQK